MYGLVLHAPKSNELFGYIIKLECLLNWKFRPTEGAKSLAFSRNHFHCWIASCFLDTKHLQKCTLHFKNVIILRDVMPCSVVKVATASTNIVPAFSGSVFLNTEPLCSSETSVYFYETRRQHISKDGYLHCYGHENHKCHMYSPENYLFFCFCHLYLGEQRFIVIFLR